MKEILQYFGYQEVEIPDVVDTIACGPDAFIGSVEDPVFINRALTDEELKELTK